MTVDAHYSAADAIVALIQYGCLTPSASVLLFAEPMAAVNSNDEDFSQNNTWNDPETGAASQNKARLKGTFHTGKFGFSSEGNCDERDIQAWMLEVLCDLEGGPDKELTRGNC
ncbi:MULTISPECIES: hypothetical protein [Halocynthiibacter]|uniref:Uncharacterized protein n=1 Tax=Halocynthiibacter halioticoli TaxID=2986804 RepID=A0AAE3LQW5_9RHOB|nr:MULTISPECIES: hypothetical protein [Halocynthiibacter]MCV6824922.1 hypothetical protein [Halocynthiibacter halioticoli]MCW4057923.1 hypothetical protein [Halocynthiibacter sp. SDUM655004]